VCVCVYATEVYFYVQLFDLYHQMDEAYQLPPRQLSWSRKMVNLACPQSPTPSKHQGHTPHQWKPTGTDSTDVTLVFNVSCDQVIN